MALNVETGSGSASAESYLSVADLKLYADGRGLSYAGKSDVQIEQALRRGTRFLDGRSRSRFLGYRTHAFDQALEWPREAVVLDWLPASGFIHIFGYQSVPGLILGNNVIPQQLKDATAEAAIRELASPGSLTPDYTPAERIVSEAVGPISTTYANDAITRPVVTIIDELLAPLLTRTSAYSGPLVRA